MSVFCLVSAVWQLIAYITYMYMYMTLFFTKNIYFRKDMSSLTPFLVCSYFGTFPITLHLQILWGRMHGPSPTSNLGGNVPQSLLSLRQCALHKYLCLFRLYVSATISFTSLESSKFPKIESEIGNSHHNSLVIYSGP